MKHLILLVIIVVFSLEGFSQHSVSFLAIGDWGRDGNNNQREVAAQMAVTAATDKVAFVLSTGDNFYESGVSNVKDVEFKKSFEQVYNQPSLQIPWYVSLGNHDYKSDPDVQVLYSYKNSIWHMPSRYYAVKIPIDKDDTTRKILLICLDTSPLIDEYYANADYAKWVATGGGGKEIAWLVNTLQDNDPTICWRIVFGHHPLMSSSVTRKSGAEAQNMREKCLDIFNKNHVDAYICGHEHLLEYMKPTGHTHYFISGAGSKLVQVSGKIPCSKFVASQNGFIEFTVSKSAIDFSIINVKGKELYKGKIDKADG